MTNWKPNDRTIRQKCNSTIGCDHFEPIRTNGRKHRLGLIAKQVDTAQTSMLEDITVMILITITMMMRMMMMMMTMKMMMRMMVMRMMGEGNLLW